MKTVMSVVLAALVAAGAATAPAAPQDHPTKGANPAKTKMPAKVEMPTTDRMKTQFADGTVLAAAAKDKHLTKFVAAVKAAGLADKLQGEGPFTIFAPTDEAFAKLPQGTLDDLMAPANQARLAGLLGNHVVPGKLMAGDAKTMKATNVQGHDLDIQVSDGGMTVDGAKVVGADLQGSNGVIHAIDTVLVPAENTERHDHDKPKDHPAH